ncbi:hypothetical protein GCM10009544_21020 [Streptomyces stramineus]|uniref:Uncharacterized protein n=1 Tax=Streptomyces stramineus TaxID=173861 RepID=A0ABP3JP77_9ACTN
MDKREKAPRANAAGPLERSSCEPYDRHISSTDSPGQAATRHLFGHAYDNHEPQTTPVRNECHAGASGERNPRRPGQHARFDAYNRHAM